MDDVEKLTPLAELHQQVDRPVVLHGLEQAGYERVREGGKDGLFVDDRMVLPLPNDLLLVHRLEGIWHAAPADQPNLPESSGPEEAEAPQV